MEDGSDLSGVTVRDRFLKDTRIANAWIEDTSITGLVLGLVVNGIDVTAYVESELDRQWPYHPYGLSHSEYPRESALGIGLDLDGQPEWATVLELRSDRQAEVTEILAGLADADLTRACPRSPAPGYPEEHPTVGQCLQVVVREECEHRRYAERDLVVLEAEGVESGKRSGGGA